MCTGRQKKPSATCSPRQYGHAKWRSTGSGEFDLREDLAPSCVSSGIFLSSCIFRGIGPERFSCRPTMTGSFSPPKAPKFRTRPRRRATTTSMRRLRRRPRRRAHPSPTARPRRQCRSTFPSNTHQPDPNPRRRQCRSTFPSNTHQPDPNPRRRQCRSTFPSNTHQPDPNPRRRQCRDRKLTDRTTLPDMRAGATSIPPTTNYNSSIPHTAAKTQPLVRRCRPGRAQIRHGWRPQPGRRSRGNPASRRPRDRRPPRRTAMAGGAQTHRPRSSRTLLSNRCPRNRPPKWCHDEVGGVGCTP